MPAPALCRGDVYKRQALATVAGLAVLIWSLGPISGAHFNPAVTLVAAVRREIGWGEAAAYLIAQCAGGLCGTAIGHLMFQHPAWELSLIHI